MSSFRFPRRLRFTRAGTLFVGGTLATGGAAIHSGNNLLFLLVGGMLGLITINGILSERSLRKLRVRRTGVSAVPAGQSATVRYEVENDRARLPSVALHIGEARFDQQTFVPYLEAQDRVDAQGTVAVGRRGVYPLERVTLSTSFPFGLFHKERDVDLPGELVVWPKLAPSVSTEDYRIAAEPQSAPRQALGAAAGRGRVEYASLREYRSGDDVRDVHWASTAKRGDLVVREFEGQAAQPKWLVVDTSTRAGDGAEELLEKAARLAKEFVDQGKTFGFVAGSTRVVPGRGRRHLTSVFDAMARVQFRGGAGAQSPHPLPEGAIVFTGQPA